MFWTVVSPASIRRARLDGTDMQILVTTELTSPGIWCLRVTCFATHNLVSTVNCTFDKDH